MCDAWSHTFDAQETYSDVCRCDRNSSLVAPGTKRRFYPTPTVSTSDTLGRGTYRTGIHERTVSQFSTLASRNPSARSYSSTSPPRSIDGVSPCNIIMKKGDRVKNAHLRRQHGPKAFCIEATWMGRRGACERLQDRKSQSSLSVFVRHITQSTTGRK